MIRVQDLARPAPATEHTRTLWVEEIDDGLRFAALRGPWDELFAECDTTPFLAWEWLYPWWRRVAPEAVPRVLVARGPEGRIEGILPLCERRERVLGVEVRRWGFMGDSWVGSDYLQPLARPGDQAAIGELFARSLQARRARIDVLELLDLPKDSLFGRQLLERFAGIGLTAERTERYLCPLVQVQGEWDGYLKSVGRRAENLARRRKWLQAQPGYALERLEDPDAVAAALPDFFRLHRLRWEKDGGSQGIRTPEVHAFHRDATALLAERGLLRLYMLRLGELPLATVYGIVHRDRFYYYQSGYDPEWARRSVGLVLLGETLADAFRERRVAFDFLRGSEPYKFEWANGERRTEAVGWVNATPGGAAWLARRGARGALKGAARRVLGTKGWERARSIKRRLGGNG